MEQGPTSQRVHSNPGTHLLEMSSKLSVLPNFGLVLGGEQLQLLAKCVQLFAHLCRKGRMDGGEGGGRRGEGVT